MAFLDEITYAGPLSLRPSQVPVPSGQAPGASEVGRSSGVLSADTDIKEGPAIVMSMDIIAVTDTIELRTTSAAGIALLRYTAVGNHHYEGGVMFPAGLYLDIGGGGTIVVVYK